MTTLEADGTVTFRVYLPHASHVHLTGTFNGWSTTSHPLNRENGDGWWRLQAHVPSGEHDFQYLVDGREWLADFAAFGVARNEFGGWVSQLIVSEEPTRLTLVPEAVESGLNQRAPLRISRRREKAA